MINTQTTARIKTLKKAALLLAAAAWLTSAASAQTHPDGSSTTYQGWGPAEQLQGGYECTLFESRGFRVGSIAFYRDGRINLTIGRGTAHFTSPRVGITTVHPLDVASFPSIPLRFRTSGYQLMVYTARFKLWENLFVKDSKLVEEETMGISSIETRCVYIVDLAGNVQFCLNCAITVS
jgi:hypothetical protein